MKRATSESGYDTYRKLLQTRYLMTKKNGKLRILDETIKELIEF